MNSLRLNIFYKGLLTFANYIIGFVTFPYITRVLGPANFGLVNFAQNTVDYFLLFATMGIATIGTREIASVRNNQTAISKQFSSILGTNLFFTIICLTIYLGCIFIVPKFHQHIELFLIGSAKIIFTAFTVEWLYTGLENFRYITFRSLAIRVIYVISVFIFIKSPSDYVLYFSMTISTVVINSLVNFSYSRKFVKVIWKNLRDLRFVKHSFRLGLYTIMTSMYITFNVMYLGLVSGDEQVGYYSTSVKLYFIAVSLFSAFTSVMLPRMSAVHAKNDSEAANNYLRKSFQLVFLLAFPIISLTIVFAPQIIDIMSGKGYMGSILPMRIIMPALIFVWLSQVIAFQGFIPLKKDKYLLFSSLLGGGLAITLNIILTAKLQSIGSAIVLLSCECVVTTFYIIIAKKKKLFLLPSLRLITSIAIKSIPYLIIDVGLLFLFNGWLSFLLAAILSAFYFLLVRRRSVS